MIDEDIEDRYAAKFQSTDDRTRKLLALRHTALFLNDHFQRDIAAYDSMCDRLKYRHIEAFRSKWGFCPVQRLCLLHVRQQAVRVFSYCGENILRVDIDLTFSKSEIQKEIGLLCESYHDFTQRADYIPSDLYDIERSLKVFDLKKSMSWADLSKYFNTSVDSVRNWFRCGKKLVQQGIPSFPAFPIPEK